MNLSENPSALRGHRLARTGKLGSTDDSLAQRLSPDIEQPAERHSGTLAYVDHARRVGGRGGVGAASAEHSRVGGERERRRDADSRRNRDHVLMGEHLEVSAESLAGPPGAVPAVDRRRGPNAGRRRRGSVSRACTDPQRQVVRRETRRGGRANWVWGGTAACEEKRQPERANCSCPQAPAHRARAGDSHRVRRARCARRRSERCSCCRLVRRP